MSLLLPLLLAVQFGNLLALENNSPGLNPSMHLNYINEYTPDLTYVGSAAYFPLLQSPSAMTFSPAGDLYVGEYCEPSPCVQISRNGVPFGEKIHDALHAMQFVANGDLIVLLSGVLGRIDANSRWIESVPLPAATFIFGFDVDRDQCTVALAAQDRVIVMSLCGQTEPKTIPGRALDVRYLPNGEILAFDGNIAIAPDATAFIGVTQNSATRYDLATRQPLAGPMMLRNAVYGARSIAIRGEWRAALNPAIRRRSPVRGALSPASASTP
jgi:hypothetical protein